MRNPIRPLRMWWGRTVATTRAVEGSVLGALGTVEDVVSNVRDRRLTKANTEELATSERNIALAAARQGCTHAPKCPPPSAPDRMKAVEVWSDDACVYLCNGLVLATRETQAPDSPSGLYTPPMPERERTP